MNIIDRCCHYISVAASLVGASMIMTIASPKVSPSVSFARPNGLVMPKKSGNLDLSEAEVCTNCGF